MSSIRFQKKLINGWILHRVGTKQKKENNYKEIVHWSWKLRINWKHKKINLWEFGEIIGKERLHTENWNCNTCRYLTPYPIGSLYISCCYSTACWNYMSLLFSLRTLASQECVSPHTGETKKCRGDKVPRGHTRWGREMRPYSWIYALTSLINAHRYHQ